MGISNVLDVDLLDAIHFKSISAYRIYTGQFGDSRMRYVDG